MKNKEYNFLISFIYGLYFVLIGHYVMTEDKEVFLSYFSEWGIYTFLSLLSIHSLFLINHPRVKEKLNIVKERKFAYLIFSFLLAHLINLYHPLLKISDYFANLLIWNQSFIIFIIGAMMFAWGAYLLKKGGDQKVLITVCMVLFIHGFYNALFLVSIKKQFSSYEVVYESVVKNNIDFKNCAKEVTCVKLNDKERKEFLLSGAQSIPDKQLKKVIFIYMNNLANQIEKDKNDITVYSYLNSPIDFIQLYQPIAVYSKKNGYLIVDYLTPNKISSDHIKTYKRLLGTATIMWLSLLLLLNFFHAIFLKYRLKKLANKPVSVEENEND